MGISTDERDQPEIEAGPRPELLEDLNHLLDDVYADEEGGDVLGPLPELQLFPSTLSSKNAEYALTIPEVPMSVSSMSFSISPHMSSTMSFSAYTSLVDLQQPSQPMTKKDGEKPAAPSEAEDDHTSQPSYNAIGDDSLILSNDNATFHTMSTAMLRRDEIEQLESTDETEYTDYGPLVAALSGLTGVVSVNSQYGRKDKPIREKTNGEKFARFIGLDDDASTFSDNTGMSISTMFTAATGLTNATGMTSTGGTFQRDRSEMSKGTQNTKQSQHRQRNHLLGQQPPLPSAPDTTRIPKTAVVSFEEPAMDSGKPSYSTSESEENTANNTIVIQNPNDLFVPPVVSSRRRIGRVNQRLRYQALCGCGSESLFDTGISFDFPWCFKAVEKAKAHLHVATTKTPPTAPEGIPEPKVPPSLNEPNDQSTCRVIKPREVPFNSNQPCMGDEYLQSTVAKNVQDSTEPSSLLGMLPSLEGLSLPRFLDIFTSAPTASDSIDEPKNKIEADKSNPDGSEIEKKIKASANIELEAHANSTVPANDDAEDICQRILQQHIQRKRKIEKATKKAIQEHLHNYRSEKVTITPLSGRTTSSGTKVQTHTDNKKGEESAPSLPSYREERDQSNVTRKPPSTKQSRAMPSTSTLALAKPKSQQNYKKTSGLKKARKPLMKTARRQRITSRLHTKNKSG